MEIADVIRWICLVFAFVAAVFSVLVFISLRDPAKFIIEANDEFATDLYNDFADRLIADPKFTSTAKAVTAAA